MSDSETALHNGSEAFPPTAPLHTDVPHIASDGATAPAPPPGPAPTLVGTRRKRRWPWLVVGAGVGVAATVGVQSWNEGNDDESDASTAEVIELSTAEVTTRNLIEFVDYEGELSRGESRTILSPSNGTITESVIVGAILERGSTVVSIDAAPVVAFYGVQPFYRDLESGDEGPDVAQLEANLWALGFTDEGALSVDGDYDDSTSDAIEEWELSLGLEETGDFDPERVVVLEGPSTVSAANSAGTSAVAGQQILLTQTTESRFDVMLNAGILDQDAVIDNVAATGTVIEQGTVLATVDGNSVFALTEITATSTRILEALAADDVERLENLLVFFGFDPDASIVVDDEADLATVAGVNRWHDSIGLPAADALGSTYYVEVPRGVEVVAVQSRSGDPIGDGALAMSLGTSTVLVTTDVVVDEIDDISVGETLEVLLADGSILPAAVASISSVADDTADGTPTVAVDIAPDEVPDNVVVGPVTIRFETSRISDATVIPTRALVSLSEGGFAVEIQANDGSTRLVAVELGAFDDGVVEVIDGDVSPGDTVVVPV